MSLTATEEAILRELIAQQAALLSLANAESQITLSLGAEDTTLADLDSVSLVSDTDLFLSRQGTTDKSVTAAIIKTFATPADASTTTKGIVELATATETTTGTDTARAVTPAGLSALTATETRSGLVELATSAEAIAGTDTARAVTPAGLSALTATETRPGLVELATSAEATAGTDTARAVTPAGLLSKIAALLLGTMSKQNSNAVDISGGTINGTTIGATTPTTGKFTTLQANTLSDGTNSTSMANPILGSAKAWVQFVGSTGTINGSFNISSITRNSAGNYTVNFTTAMANTAYVPNISQASATNNPQPFIFCSAANGTSGVAPTTSSFRFVTANTGSALQGDAPYVCIAVFGL